MLSTVSEDRVVPAQVRFWLVGRWT